MLVAVLRHSVAFIFLFFTLFMAFLFLAVSEYVASAACQKAGGVFGESRASLESPSLLNTYISRSPCCLYRLVLRHFSTLDQGQFLLYPSSRLSPEEGHLKRSDCILGSNCKCQNGVS